MLLFGREAPTDEMFTFQMDRLLALAADIERVRRGVPPEVMAGDEAPILDRWILAQTDGALPCRAVDGPSKTCRREPADRHVRLVAALQGPHLGADALEVV